MCSSQTGCSVNLPRVFVRRLTEEEVRKYDTQERKLDQSKELREVKKLKLSSGGKKKKKKSNTTSISIKLDSNTKNVTPSGQLPSLNETILSKLRKRSRSLFKSSASSKGSSKPHSKSTSTIREGIPKLSLKRGSRICKTKKLESKVSSIKKSKRRSNRIYQNLAKKRIFDEEKNTAVEIFNNGIEQVKPIQDLKIVFEDTKETITREKTSLKQTPLVKITVDDEKESEDDEITVIEEITNVWNKILSNSIKTEKNLNEKQQLNRAEYIANLIDENKILSIPVPESQHTIKTSATKFNFNVSNVDLEQCVSESKAKEARIKIKSPQSLGIANENASAEGSDCRSILMGFDQLSVHDKSLVTGICVLYPQYFNDHIKTLICNLNQSLKAIQIELCESDRKLIVEDGSIELYNKQVELTLKKYSKEFVNTFNIIINTFEDRHKGKMIPIVYLHLLKFSENSTLMKQEDIRSIVLQLFKIEEFSCSYDIISHLTWEAYKQCLSIYDRWLEVLLPKVNMCEEPNPQPLVNSADINERHIELEVTSIIEKTAKENTILLSDTVLDGCMTSHETHCSANCSQTQEDLEMDKCSIGVIESVTLDNLSKGNNEHFECKEISSSSFECCNTDDPNPCEENCTSTICNKLIGNREAEDPSSFMFEHQESDFLLNCLNDICTKKKTVPCFYCKEFVTCEDLCQVGENQIVNKVPKEEDILVLISCEPHNSITWKDDYSEEWSQIEDHNMPYEPQCWRAGCDKKALVICVCKARGYCTVTCQEEDWFSCHHEICSRQPHPDLLS